MSWQHHSDLMVWNKAMDLADEIYRLTRHLPMEERYSLCDQMHRAAVSIPSNIAEGHGRHNDNEFKRFLLIAKGSNAELETQLYLCVRLNYLNRDQIQPAISLCDEISRMIVSMVKILNNDK